MWGFPKIRVPFWGGPIIRLIVFWSPDWGPPKIPQAGELRSKLYALQIAQINPSVPCGTTSLPFQFKLNLRVDLITNI